MDDKKLEQSKALGDIVNNRNAEEAAERIQNRRWAGARLCGRATNRLLRGQAARAQQLKAGQITGRAVLTPDGK